MLVFTVVMIVMYSLLLIGTLVFKEVNKDADNFEKSDITGQLIYMGIGCTWSILVFSYLLTYVIYLFNALNVDSLLIPTFIMLTLFIFNAVKGAIQSAQNKANNIKPKIKDKATPYSMSMRVLTYIYFIYMLFILIVGS